jgi:hypothetical protein
MMLWITHESAHTASTAKVVGNNPLNISTGADISGKVIGTTAVGPGIAQYADLATGIQATAAYLTARQPGIVAGFRAGDGTSAVQAITASNFVSGGKGGNQYGGALVTQLQTLLGTATAPVQAITASATVRTAAQTARVAFLQHAINVPSDYPDMTATTYAKYKAELATLLSTTVAAPTGSTGATMPPAGSGPGAIDQVTAAIAAAAPPGGYPASIVGIPDQFLGAWGNTFQLQPGHVLTQQDVNNMMTTLQADGYFANDDPMGTARQVTFAILSGEIGQPWSTNVEKDIQTKMGTAATAAGTSFNPITGVSDALTSLGSTAVSIFTYLAALVVIALGIYLYSKGGSGQEAPVVPTG